VLGASLYLHRGPGLPLAIAAGVAALTVLTVRVSHAPLALDRS
jgi:hypothetical protein